MKKENKKLIKIGVISIIAIGFASIGTRLILNRTKKRDSIDFLNKDDNNSADDFGIKVGDTLAPRGAYVNIRSSAKVDDGGIFRNLIKQSHAGVIGTVIGSTVSKEDLRTWYKVKFPEPINVWKFYLGNLSFSEGYVRSDVVKKV